MYHPLLYKHNTSFYLNKMQLSMTLNTGLCINFISIILRLPRKPFFWTVSLQIASFYSAGFAPSHNGAFS